MVSFLDRPNVLQCSRLSDDSDSVVDSDAEFDAVLRSTTDDVINDVTTADSAGAEDTTVISVEQVISEIESMLEVCFAVRVITMSHITLRATRPTRFQVDSASSCT